MPRPRLGHREPASSLTSEGMRKAISVRAGSNMPAPVLRTQYVTVRFTTELLPVGIQIMMRGHTRWRSLCSLAMKWGSMAAVRSKSALSPSRMGWMDRALKPPALFPQAEVTFPPCCLAAWQAALAAALQARRDRVHGRPYSAHPVLDEGIPAPQAGRTWLAKVLPGPPW